MLTVNKIDSGPQPALNMTVLHGRSMIDYVDLDAWLTRQLDINSGDVAEVLRLIRDELRRMVATAKHG